MNTHATLNSWGNLAGGSRAATRVIMAKTAILRVPAPHVSTFHNKFKTESQRGKIQEPLNKETTYHSSSISYRQKKFVKNKLCNIYIYMCVYVYVYIFICVSNLFAYVLFPSDNTHDVIYYVQQTVSTNDHKWQGTWREPGAEQQQTHPLNFACHT